MVELTEIEPKEDNVLSDRFITVEGKRFHYIWLYDHCLCPRCHHPSSFQKINDLSDRPTFPKPKSVEINDEQLIIDWDEDIPHRSIFPLSWLLNRSYDPQPKQEVALEKIFWNKMWLEANPPEFPKFRITPFEEWIDQLHTLGFTIIRNIDWSNLDDFVNSIGPIYYLAKYGRYATVKAIPKGQDLSLSADGHELSPHTDLTFIPTTQIVQLLYCVENETSGGESIVLDGFRIAQDFRQDHPQYFEILSQTPVKFWQLYQDWDYYVSHTTPIIKLNETGTITNIFFSHKNLGLDLPFEQVEKFYEAYGSNPNCSDYRRIGFSIRYIPTSISPIAGTDSAMLVRGADTYGYWELEKRPKTDFEPEMIAYHQNLRDQRMNILMNLS